MAVLAPAPAQAQVCAPLDDGRLAEAFYEGTVIFWEPRIEYQEMVLTIGGPCEDIVKTFRKGEPIAFDIREITKVTDGTYTWQLRRVATIDPGVQKDLEASRGTGEEDAVWWNYFQKGAIPAGPFVESASFTVEGGEIIDPNQVEEEKRGTLASRAGRAFAGSSLVAGLAPGSGGTDEGNGLRPMTAADQVIPDDLIVQGSECVGFDCVNGESFGFDTIRLKENNTRIQFNDTSVGSFPTGNWQIRANSSSSGGQSFLGFVDQGASSTSETGTLVLAVEAGARANALYVESDGDVGLGTSNPVLDFHVSSSNTPGIRLEQTNAGGFTAQTWDIAGNEANFFVRDVTGGSRLPFRIRPDAPTSSIDISSDGDVGVGTASPDAKLHVTGSDGNTDLLVEETSGTAATRTVITARNNGQTRFVVHNTNAATPAGGGYFFAHFDNGSFVIRPSGGGVGIVMDASGNVTTEGNLTVNGTFANPSSRALKQGFEPVDPQAVLAKFAELPISQWTYTSDPASRRHLGPTAEDFLAAFGFGSDGKYIYPIDVQGVTMAALKGLNEKVTELAHERDRLQHQNAELAERLARIETLLAAQQR